MPLPENKIAVAKLKQELELKILGQRLPAWSCCCKTINHPKSTAISIRPGGEQERYAGQETSWTQWTVEMLDDGAQLEPGDFSYSIGISSFLTKEEIEVLFAKHFGDDHGSS